MHNPPLAELDESSVDNVYIFLSDALRYDELPEEIVQRGLAFKAVAHALATPQCLPTISSGRLPPKHGVLWFDQAMPGELPTFFDITGFETGYSDLFWHRSLQGLLGNPGTADVESAEEPFVVVEHDNGGHAPYPELEIDDAAETFRRVDSRDELLQQYRNSISGSVRRFEDRLRVLERRGVRENTLVIFMADHGELLGEHGGFVGHGLPMAPEVAYVPVVFIHPSLPNGERGEHLLQQVDLYPTIVDVLTGRTPSSDGQTLTAPVEEDRPAYSQGILPPAKFRGTYLDPAYDARSIWTRYGGHVFLENPRLARLVTAGYEATRSGFTAAYNSHRNVIRTLGTTLSHYLRNYHRYGDPTIGKTEARESIETMGTEVWEGEQRELSEETKEQLADLGYV